MTYWCWTLSGKVSSITKRAISVCAFAVSDGVSQSVRNACCTVEALQVPNVPGLNGVVTNSWNVPVAPGAKIAVIEGPLNKAVPFTFRLLLPAGARIAPHVHPAFERVTVLSGIFHFAHGDSFDPARTQALGQGSVAVMPPGAPMFGYTREETVIQLHGIGPWGIRYLNPADDPRKK